MTDRIKGLTVTLDHDYRDDDVDAIVNAIMMVKGVTGVEKHVVQLDDYFARERVVCRIREKILEAFQEIKDLT